jgi:hypothetical protein
VLTEDNAEGYWGRSDAFDTVLNLGGTPGGRDALGRAIAVWLRHMLRIDATIDPLPALTDPDWRWFIGLDTEATRIGNALWEGQDAPEADRLLALFRLVPSSEAPITANMRDHPIYLMLAANADNLVRFKPQNLLTGLPLAEMA